MNEPDSPAKAEIELARFRHGEGVEDTCEVLKKAGISYRLSTNVAAMDISNIGHGGAEGSMIIMVAKADEQKAHEALLENARLTVQNGVAPDFHLRQWQDEDLLDVLEEPREWSVYDVAAAESLLRERGVAFKPPSFELTESMLADRAEKERLDRHHSRVQIYRIILGAVFIGAYAILYRRGDKQSLQWLRVVELLAVVWLIRLLWSGMKADDEGE